MRYTIQAKLFTVRPRRALLRKRLQGGVEDKLVLVDSSSESSLKASLHRQDWIHRQDSMQATFDKEGKLQVSISECAAAIAL